MDRHPSPDTSTTFEETPAAELGDAYVEDRPGQVDGQRGRAAYSSAEKAYEQFNTAHVARLRDQSAYDADRDLARRTSASDLDQARAHAEQLFQQSVRQQEELFQQRTRQQDDLHAVIVQTIQGGQVTDQGLLDGVVMAVMNALNASGYLKPPAA